MDATASQTTSLTIVYSALYSDADQGKHQSSAPLALGGEFTGHRWWLGKCFHLMASSCWIRTSLSRASSKPSVLKNDYLTNPYNWKIMLPKASNYFAIGIVMVPSWGPCYRSRRRREILKRCPYFSRLYLGVDIDKSCTCAWPYICIYRKTYICIYSLLYGMCSYNSYRKCHQQFIYPNSANIA